MIEYKTVNSEREYYVVFDRRRGDWRFWNLFTSKDFDHVWLMTEVGYNTLVIKPTPSGCEVDLWPCRLSLAVSFVDGQGATMLKYNVKYNILPSYQLYSIMSCVSYTKYLLGVRGFLICTPLRLYKKLIKLGAKKY